MAILIRRGIIPPLTSWTPASSNPEFWFDASVGSSVHTSGGIVTQWDDLSSHARHLTPIATGPAYSGSAIQNGLPAVDFSNNLGACAVKSASFSVSFPHLIYAVFRTNTSQADDSFGIMVEGATSGSTLVSKASGDSFKANITTDGVAFLSTGIITSLDTPYSWYGGFTGAGSGDITKITGGTEQTGNAGTTGFVGGVQIGANTGGFKIYDFMCEVFCIPSWSAGDLTNAAAYTLAKWGV